MSKGKLALITALFTMVTFVLPFILLLIFVSSEYISVYVAVFGLIFFASLGFIVALILSVKKELLDAFEEIKVQNAAIAFRLSKTDKADNTSVEPTPAPVTEEVKPAEVMPASPKENFDDFQ